MGQPLWTSTTASRCRTGKKSVTIRLTIGSLEKTLTSTEIEECASGVIKKLAKRLGAELRTRVKSVFPSLQRRINSVY